MEKVKESILDFMVDDPKKKLILIIERQQFSRTKCYSFLCLLGFFFADHLHEIYFCHVTTSKRRDS